MPRSFRLALAQINTTVGDIPGNTAKILDYLERARQAHADLVAFPELAITGYPPEDLVLRPAFLKDNLAAMETVVAASRGIAVMVGFVSVDPDTANAAAVGYDGKLVDIYQKMYLPNYGVFDEDRYFMRGSACPVYTINGVKVGVGICEDVWYSVGPIAVQRDAGAEVIVNINGSPFHAGKRIQRESMIATRAADHELFVAYLNAVGGQDELVFDGASLIYDSAGDLVKRGPAFQEDLILADLDIESVLRTRLRAPRTRKENTTILKEIGESKTVHVSSPGSEAPPTLPVECSGRPAGTEVEEVYQALVVGTRDYLTKSGFQKVLVGLSGGIDSALTAAIAADALGHKNVVGVSMPSRYSSEGSITDSQELARALDIDLWIVPIGPAHVAFADMLEPYFQGHPTQHGRRKRSGAHPGQHFDDHLQQIRLDGADHRQQERNGHGLRHPVRRHGRRLCGHQGRAQDPGLPALRVAQPTRQASPGHPAGYHQQAAQRRTERGPAGPGHPANLRPAGPGGESLCGAGQQLRRDGGNGV